MPTDLYGGAITIKQLPASFIDVSHIRDVPDTQEVFINETSTTSGKLDQSLIIDLLEKVDPIEYQEAIHLHLQDIVPSHVHNQPLEEVESDGVVRFFSYVSFKPEYKKVEADSPKQIVTLLCLIRLDKVDTDVLLQYIIPLKEHANVNFNGDSETDKFIKENYTLFREIGTSFTVKDWNLFG
ncbi:Nuclear import protein MOG1 [Candida viswanathii]|uniref:Nuclear import protein MOG1 n=1 Tax=Candida viswanathii TaxID=5486 RepID=A0A367XYA7_9ASCO|nr:Nuclear import protein MOG1 [Candida viswanathii]